MIWNGHSVVECNAGLIDLQFWRCIQQTEMGIIWKVNPHKKPSLVPFPSLPFPSLRHIFVPTRPKKAQVLFLPSREKLKFFCSYPAAKSSSFVPTRPRKAQDLFYTYLRSPYCYLGGGGWDKEGPKGPPGGRRLEVGTHSFYLNIGKFDRVETKDAKCTIILKGLQGRSHILVKNQAWSPPVPVPSRFYINFYIN